MATSIPTWQSPRLDYTVQDGVTAKDFVRIEGNILNLRNTGRPFATTTGTSTQYAATIVDIPQLEAGLGIRLKIHQTNSGVATLNLNGLGIKQIVTNDQQPTLANDMRAGQILDFSYNGEAWQIVGATQFVPVQTADTVYQKTLHEVTAQVVTANNYTVEVPELKLSEWDTKLLVKFDSQVTGAASINLNNLGEVPIKLQGSNGYIDPITGTLNKNETYMLIYHDGIWEVMDSRTRSRVSSLETKVTNTVNFGLGYSISSSSWSSYSGVYRALISNSSITADSMVDVNVQFSYRNEARNMLPFTDATSGGVYVYASEKPTSTIICNLKIVRDV